MASVPTPRSKSQILSDILDAFLSRSGLTRLKVGGPLLSMFEAAGQSDFRNSQDIFNQLASISLDSASDQATDKIALDEGTQRTAVSAASGLITVSDTSFSKISTSIYQGASAPNSGTLALKVSDASLFPNTGQIYIGRNTVNYEGPLSYTAKTSFGSYWTLTVTGGTTKFHNISESVILAQGGVRVIESGTIVQTPQGNVSEAIKYSTLYSAQIEDGEIEVNNIEVVAQQPGVVGNVPAQSIREFQSAPFQGAAVNNPLPFTNALPSESTPSLKEKIKALKQSKQLGTKLAIETKVKGVTSKEDNKTVISASGVARKGETSTLYIDDGTGYEESLDGVSSEILMDSALGGEQLFQLSSQRPIARAFATTTLEEPFNLAPGKKLAIKVGGILYEHTFNSSEFKSISNANSYEVIASINGNPKLAFNARTANNATKVTVFAKSDVNEDIEVVVPSDGNDANQFLGFPTQLNYTLKLYKNDVFLYKDGNPAIIISEAQGNWSTSIASGDTLEIQVDNTSVQTITFTNTDFIDNNTGYTNVSASNSLTSWATVFNAKVIGVTATGSNGALTLVSNLGNNDRAQLKIVGGSLCNKGMFIVDTEDLGKTSDYTLNRNTGQLKLADPLEEGDNLIVATPYTRAYVQSEEFPSSVVTLAGTANLWFFVDGNSEIVPTGVGSNTSLTITAPGSNRARYTGPTDTFGTSVAGSYLERGDWVVIWDPQFTDKGMWRISDLAGAPNYQWFEVERNTITPESKMPNNNGIVFARSEETLQKIQVASGVNIPLSTIASNISSSLIGGSSSVYRNTFLRVNTNTYDLTGDIMLVTADLNGQVLTLESGSLVNNQPSHFASVETSNSEVGTPNFKWTTVATTPSALTFTLTNSTSNIGLRSGDMITYRKRLDTSSFERYGADADNYEIVHDITGSVVTPRVNSKTDERLVSDRVYSSSAFALSGNDNLSVLLDEESDSKNFNIPLYRNIVPLAGATYGSAPFQVRDADNSNAALTDAFGVSTTFFNDFALLMNARGKAHSIIANKTILYRYQRFGQEGNYVKFAYSNPSAPSQAFSLSSNVTDGFSNLNLSLPSGTERTGLNVNGNNYFVVTGANKTYPAGIGTVVRTGGTTVTVTLDTAGTTNVHTLSIGDIVYQVTSVANFIAGPKSITGVTANTFTYTEAGANVANAVATSYLTSQRPAGTTYTASALSSSGTHITATIGTHVFQVGSTVYFEPGHTEVSGITVTAGAKVVTSIAATTVTWAEATTAGAAVLVAGVTYTVSSGATHKITLVYFKAEVAIAALSRTGSTVTATINTTPIISQHPYAIGDIVYLSPGEVNFPAGPKIITSATSTTFQYVEAGAAAVSTITEYFTTTSSDINLTGGGTPVVAGNIAHISSSSSLDSLLAGNFRVFSVTSTRFAFLKDIWYQDGLATLYLGNTVPKKLGDASYLRFSPINAAAASANSIVAWINSNASNVLSAVLVPDNSGGANAGTATVGTATEEEYFLTTLNASVNATSSISIPSFSMFDGINWVQDTNLVNSSSSTISLKNPVNGELAVYNDFNNEDFKLVPVTVKNLQNYLGSTGASGLGANGFTTASKDGKKLQLNSNLSGSQGAVHVTGGSGNAASALVVDTGAEIASTYSKVTVATNQIDSFIGGAWVSVQGTNNALKEIDFGPGTSIFITPLPNNEQAVGFLGSPTTVINVLVSSISTTRTYQIEKHGKFMAYIETSVSPLSLSSVSEGDIVTIVDTGLSEINTGTFQVINVDASNNTFWIENASGIEEVATLTNTIYFTTYDSVAAGDTFVVNTELIGSSNKGTFDIVSIDPTIPNAFRVTGMSQAFSTPMDGDYVFFHIKEKSPIKLVKQIRTINQNADDADFSDIVFTTRYKATKMNEITGSVITTLDKLAFPTTETVGLDGYSYNTGLLAEVNRVVYGDETNPSVYPGLSALSDNINISGPLIKVITVSLAIRLRTGSPESIIIARVKNAVASIINNNPVGEDIAISDIVTAANKIDGVLAVSIISPNYSLGNDLINVQLNEKTKVLDIDTNVLVSLVA